jgi:hypothetical protein
MPCRAMTSKHSRFCDLAASGDTRYDAMLCGDSPPPLDPDPARAAILARRAKKARVALGVKVAPGRR